MKRIKNYMIMMLILLSSASANDIVHGTVYGTDENSEKVPLSKASIRWMNTGIGVLTDSEGEFSIARTEQSNKLIISYVGYKSDTLNIGTNDKKLDINLVQSLTTDEVNVVAELPLTPLFLQLPS